MGAPAADPSVEFPNPQSEPVPGLTIIHAGLYRTGTASMAAAYRILGLHAHHGLDDVPGNNWLGIEHAVEACFPHVADKSRPPYKRSDWDDLFGEYNIVTDLGSVFVSRLLDCYPEAKVVVVQRDFEDWWESFSSEVLGHFQRRDAWIVGFVAWWIGGFRAPKCMSKLLPGFFGVPHARDVSKEVARKRYEEYYDEVRRTVPKERRLEYELGDGWVPLCAFLGKDVPDVKFPRVNDRATHAVLAEKRRGEILRSVYILLIPLCVGLLAVTGGYFIWRTAS